jgi:hypothetical protein
MYCVRSIPNHLASPSIAPAPKPKERTLSDAEFSTSYAPTNRKTKHCGGTNSTPWL